MIVLQCSIRKLNSSKGLQLVLPSRGMFGKLAKVNNDGTGARR